MEPLSVALIVLGASAVLAIFAYLFKGMIDRVDERLDKLEERMKRHNEDSHIKIAEDSGGLTERFSQIQRTHVDIDRRLVRLEAKYFRKRNGEEN